MPRLLFEKRGQAVWISHLDLMRLFQRAFKRAGLQLKHTQGYNPRPSVSIALPMSVGVESSCELLDFGLDGQAVDGLEIQERLNRVLIGGVKVLSVYEGGRKLQELALLESQVQLEYDHGIPEGTLEALKELFVRQSLLVEKKSKSGPVETDLIPMLRHMEVTSPGDGLVLLHAVACCQNPTLNPMLLMAAVERYLPAFRPDFARCARIEIYDRDEKIFR